MYNYEELGFIYRNKEGKFLVRFINRGFFDTPHYIIKFVDSIEDATLFPDRLCLIDPPLKYRTLFAERIIKSCHVMKVKRWVRYLKETHVSILEE